jgi:hypothetical protein
MPFADNIPLIIAILVGLLALYTAACIYFGNDM